MDILHEFLSDLVKAEFPTTVVRNFRYGRGTATELQVDRDTYELSDGDKTLRCRHVAEALITDDNHIKVSTLILVNDVEFKERNLKDIPDDWNFVIGGTKLADDLRPKHMYDRAETVLDSYDPEFNPEVVVHTLKQELAKPVERLSLDEARLAKDT